MESFDVESKEGKRKSSTSSSQRHQWNKFNCLVASALTLFVGVFLLILFNFMIGRQEVVVEIESLQASIKDSHHSDTHSEEETCEEEDLCLTKECVVSSARIMSFMDESKEPCDDFHEFACGNYPKLKAVRFGEDVYDPQIEATDNMDINIKRLMDEKVPKTSSESFTSMKTLYDSCLNATERNENASDTLVNFFKNHHLWYPILDAEAREETSWIQFVGEMEKHGIHTLFHPYTVALDTDLTSVVLKCSMPMLPPRIYLNPNDEESQTKIYFYKNVVLLFLDYMGIKRAEGKLVFEEIMTIETEMAQAYTGENAIGEDCNQPCSKSRCPPCKVASSEELHPLSRQHETQLQGLYAEVYNTPYRNIDIRTDCTGNFEEMMRILNDSPKRTVLNYLGWRAVSHLMAFMGSDYQSLFNHYAGRLLVADTVPATKWKECTQFIRKHMGVVIAKALIDENYIKQEQFDEIKKRFNDVKDSFVHLLHHVSWLDNQTMSIFTEKLNKMQLQIGYPDIANQPGVLDETYKALKINPGDSFLENVMQLRAFLVNGTSIVPSLRESNSHLQDLKPLETSARYHYHSNMVEIGLGNLMSPLMKYGEGLQKYLEYGQDIVLAHQISHAFDTVGITYDGDGKQINTNQLPDIVRNKFYAFVACLSQQYAAPHGHDPSDISIVNRDMADLGSFFITSAGLDHSIKLDHGDDKGRLPGLPYTKRQIYFLQASQMFCEIRETYSMRILNEAPLRSKKERVNKAISNMVNFGDVFKCSPGTAMNPASKCNLLS